MSADKKSNLKSKRKLMFVGRSILMLGVESVKKREKVLLSSHPLARVKGFGCQKMLNH
jgi:hypothetical protein